MNRRNLFGLTLLFPWLGRAQVTSDHLAKDDTAAYYLDRKTDNHIKSVFQQERYMTARASWERGAKTNNQCPVCGFTAEPITVTADIRYLGVDKQNLTRCEQCNAAFWQDIV